MKKLMIVTAAISVHPRHSAGWVKDELAERLGEFAEVNHLSVEDFQDKKDGANGAR